MGELILKIASRKAAFLDRGDLNEIAFELEDMQGNAVTPESLRSYLEDMSVAPCDVQFEWSCAICLEAASLDEDVCALDKLSCSHVFHRACLANWIARQGSCPICRGPAPRLNMDFALEGPAWFVYPSAAIDDAAEHDCLHDLSCKESSE